MWRSGAWSAPDRAALRRAARNRISGLAARCHRPRHVIPDLIHPDRATLRRAARNRISGLAARCHRPRHVIPDSDPESTVSCPSGHFIPPVRCFEGGSGTNAPKRRRTEPSLAAALTARHRRSSSGNGRHHRPLVDPKPQFRRLRRSCQPFTRVPLALPPRVW